MVRKVFRTMMKQRKKGLDIYDNLSYNKTEKPGFLRMKRQVGQYEELRQTVSQESPCRGSAGFKWMSNRKRCVRAAGVTKIVPLLVVQML